MGVLKAKVGMVVAVAERSRHRSQQVNRWPARAFDVKGRGVA